MIAVVAGLLPFPLPLDLATELEKFQPPEGQDSSSLSPRILGECSIPFPLGTARARQTSKFETEAFEDRKGKGRATEEEVQAARRDLSESNSDFWINTSLPSFKRKKRWKKSSEFLIPCINK